MGPPYYMRPFVDRHVVLRLIALFWIIVILVKGIAIVTSLTFYYQ
jgi:hypothetical protein